MVRYFIDYTYPYNTVVYQPGLSSFYEYPNINKDSDLHDTVTRYFYKKMLRKFDGDNKAISNISRNTVYKYLKRYADKTNTMWWDLQRIKKTVMSYLIRKIIN